MNYHNITKDDMLNGDGLRVVLWVAGCTHHCHNCQNPITWDVAGGIPFDEAAEKELFDDLSKPYIEGISMFLAWGEIVCKPCVCLKVVRFGMSLLHTAVDGTGCKQRVCRQQIIERVGTKGIGIIAKRGSR